MSTPLPPSLRLRIRCPRGHGRLFFQQHCYGAYLSCLICGYVLEDRRVADHGPDLLLPAWWRAQLS